MTEFLANAEFCGPLYHNTLSFLNELNIYILLMITHFSKMNKKEANSLIQ
jgi:hypothetical protein